MKRWLVFLRTVITALKPSRGFMRYVCERPAYKLFRDYLEIDEYAVHAKKLLNYHISMNMNPLTEPTQIVKDLVAAYNLRVKQIADHYGLEELKP